MTTSYPGGLDSFTNPTGTDTLDTAAVLHSAQHANLNDAVEAMQAELGVNPSGSAATVAARFAVVEGDVAALAPKVYTKDVVADFGAVVDGTTDDTAAWQAALNWAGAAGGVIECSRAGVSIIGGPLQDTGGANAQLVLPDVHMLDAPQIGIEIRGPFEQSAVCSVVGAAVTPTSGLVLKSTLASGSGAVIGGYGSGTSYQNFTFVHLTLRDLTVRTVANPTISGVDLRHVDSCTLDGVIVDTGQYSTSLTEPTTATSFGVRLPTLNNGAGITLRKVSVFGFYNGLEHSEHASLDDVSVGATKVAITATAANHASHYRRVLVSYYATGLKFTGTHYLDVEQWDTEHASSGWMATTYDVDDASNYGHGTITWAAVLQGVGPHDSFVVNGGTNLHTYRVGEAPAGGGGATQYTKRDRLVAAAGNDTVTLGATPIEDSVFVWVNNVIKWPVVDYARTGSVVSFATPLAAGDVVLSGYQTTNASAPAASLSSAGALVSDTFNRADSTTTLGTASDGVHAWTAHSGTWGITGNRAYLVSNDTASRHATVDAGVSNCTVTATVYLNGAGESRYFGLAGRMDATAQNGYLVQINGPSLNIGILKMTGGSTVGIGSTASYSPVSGDVLSFEMSGSTLTVKVNGTTLVSTTDSSYSSNTRCGIWTYTDQGRFDDFSVTS